jgi:hypothetical protein
VDRPDEMLEEPLFVHGAFIRRWDEFAQLPRADTADAPRRQARTGWLRIRGDVPTPRLPQTVRWEREPAVD